jgi:tRNA modification GTPase
MGEHANTDTKTIVAIATPVGRGGIGVIRVSGPLSSFIAEQILGKTLKPRYATFGAFYDKNGGVIDQGIALYFTAPHSFTGEDVLELHAHGGMIVLDCLLRRVLDLGAKMARPGEFSERAFLNGKINLVQAEAIADLIDAASEQAAACAMRSLQGKFSEQVNKLAESIENIRINIEAAIDFPEEHLELTDSKKNILELQNILQQLDATLQVASQGTLLCEGVNTVIIGKPNAGKSSLLNQLSGQDVAIVTDIPGTTRDVLRSSIQVDGIPIHLIDTAGLHESEDAIEREGIRRTRNETNKADLVLLIIDASLDKTRDLQLLAKEIIPDLSVAKKIIIVFNKIDLTNEVAQTSQDAGISSVFISAKEGAGLSLLKESIKAHIGFSSGNEGIFSARRRHLEALKSAKEYLLIAIETLKQQQLDLSAENLRIAHLHLQEITGKFSSVDLLNKIFSNFCIGK